MPKEGRDRRSKEGTQQVQVVVEDAVGEEVVEEERSGGEGREQALLKAMAPYLSEKRREKLDNALRLAKLARIARLAMETGGGDEAL